MKTLLGLQQPISGQIEMGDGLRQNEIGYLPQQTIRAERFSGVGAGDRVVWLPEPLRSASVLQL